MQKRVPLVQWTFLLFFTGYRAPSLPGIYTDSTPLSSFTERKRESGIGWDGVNGRILRCKFHSTRPLLPFLSIFRSLFHSCRSPFSLCPTVRPTFLYLVSLFHLSLSFYFLLLVFFIYDRPPLSLKSSRRSPLFFFLFLFSNFAPSPSLFLSLSHVTEHPMELSRSPRSDGHAFSRFVAISTEQKRERKLLAERWRGPVVDAAAVVAGSGADGAERNGAGKAPAELINSDGPRYPANPLNDNIVRHHARLRRRIERER